MAKQKLPDLLAPSFVPRMPTSVKDTGLGLGLLVDLTMKFMYYEGNLTGYELSERLRLPYSGVVDQVLDFLKREKLVEVKGTGGFAESAFQYAISEKGRATAREALERSQYAGPAPVTLQAYTEGFRCQPLVDVVVHPRTIREALAHLVINEDTFAHLGPAVNSGRSLFLFGHPGNGKTAIAESIGEMLLSEAIYVPYAIAIGGQIVRVYDSVNHKLADQSGRMDKEDSRWVRIQRPVIITGGELTLDTLDLVYDENSKHYEAPFQMKANGGMLLIDDFGRQTARPRDLLNRWIVPLEKRIDFLTLHTGRKIEVPFDVLIVFSTNLEPRDLVDEAFLRRIRYKIEIKDPSWDEYREIFQRMCRARNVPFEEQSLTYLIQEHYLRAQRVKRSCHPRDLIDQVIGIARYLDVEPTLSKNLIDLACESYFVEF
ncbi:MAG: AAA family ATPase [Anaerolineae bacterium]|nr:AAA family ATPase [Anaerolineae bacterium]